MEAMMIVPPDLTLRKYPVMAIRVHRAAGEKINGRSSGCSKQLLAQKGYIGIWVCDNRTASKTKASKAEPRRLSKFRRNPNRD